MCPLYRQCRSSFHETTARKKWAKDDNKKVLFSYFKAKEEAGGYRK